MSNEKKYLKFRNKIGYGIGYGGYAMTSSLIMNFTLLVMTDSIGLNAGIIGTLMMVSKVFDGISDVLFGTMIDRTNTRMGKARPWMFGAGFGIAICTILTFVIPPEMNDILKYAWFFIFYTVYNSVFATAVGISFNSLTVLITKNPTERVQLGVYSFMFGLGFQMVIVAITVPIAASIGWAPIAIIYSLIGVLLNVVSVYSVKELPPEELLDEKVEEEKNDEKKGEKIGLLVTFKYLLSNMYYIRILLINILFTIGTNLGTASVYYFKYVLHNENLFGLINGSAFAAMIVGLAFAPMITKKFGIYRGNLGSYSISTIFKLLFVGGALLGNIPVMVVSNIATSIFGSPIAGTMNAVTADIADYQYKKTGVRIDGAMYSCVSMGTKVGAALGTGLCGWLLAAGGYVANASIQSASTVTMLNVIYLWIPIASQIITILLLAGLNVKKAIEQLSVTK